MVKLKVLSGKAVCRILASQGFVEVRRRSSHVVMQKVTTDGGIDWSGVTAVTIVFIGDYHD